MLAILAERLIDGSGRLPIADPLVLVEGDRIVDVQAGPTRIVPESAELQSFPGSTIVPGLIDAHLHVAGLLVNAMFEVEDPDTFTDEFMRRLSRYGITAVRDTGSPDIGPTFRVLKDGRPGWPRFFGSGFNLDGAPGGPWRGLRSIANPRDAASFVDELAGGGADFVKVYAWMDGDVLDAVVRSARRRGLRVAGHVGHRLTAEEAVRRGVTALEHVRIGSELLEDADREVLHRLPTRKSDPLSSFAAWRFIDPAGERAGQLIGLLLDEGVFITPTLCLSESILRPDRHDRLTGDWPQPPSIARTWSDFRYDTDFSAEDRRLAPLELERQLAFLGRAHEAGVRIAAGTDTPNPFIAPGNSLHRELELLVECGLTPLQAITAATSTAADLIGANDIGRVESGRLADLVIVAGDPASSVGALRNVQAVVKGGEFIVTARPAE